MAIGAPWFEDIHRRVMRSPVNPLDKSTIVSVYPLALNERKPTIEPGIFQIAAGSYEKPQTLVVGSSSWWRELDNEQPLLEIPISSVQVADSVVRDYVNGMLACDMGEKMPGLFFIPGEVTKKQIREEHSHSIEQAKTRQKNWYLELVKIADILWARTNGNPLAANELMKLAAQELGIKDKPWIRDFSTIVMEHCLACGMMRNPLYPICPSCHTIVDKKKYEEMGLLQAQVGK